jgi:hypothetical protein
MGDVQPDLRRRQGDYGPDGDFRLIPVRWQAVIAAAIAVAMAALTVRDIAAGTLVGAVATSLLTLGLVLFMGSYLRTTRVGKFKAWARILSDLRLRGDEQVLPFRVTESSRPGHSPLYARPARAASATPRLRPRLPTWCRGRPAGRRTLRR